MSTPIVKEYSKLLNVTCGVLPHFYAYWPKGIYVELHVGFGRRGETLEHLVETKNWISRLFFYFPEYLKIYRKEDDSYQRYEVFEDNPASKGYYRVGSGRCKQIIL